MASARPMESPFLRAEVFLKGKSTAKVRHAVVLPCGVRDPGMCAPETDGGCYPGNPQAQRDGLNDGGRSRSHNQELAAAIAQAFMELPVSIREGGPWPDYSEGRSLYAR